MSEGAPAGARDRVVFQVEVEPEAEPISGVLRRDGSELPFVGWVGLAGALERILSEPHPGSADHDTTGRNPQP